MKSIISTTAGMLLMIAASAFAGTSASAEENGWLWIAFLGFGALIIVFQLVPSMILFSSMLRGLFSSKEVSPASENPTGKNP